MKFTFFFYIDIEHTLKNILYLFKKKKKRKFKRPFLNLTVASDGWEL